MNGAKTVAMPPLEARRAELADILKGLEAAGMKAEDLSDNELAKDHARYLVGGKRRVPVRSRPISPIRK
jgi:hypothetical protein